MATLFTKTSSCRRHVWGIGRNEYGALGIGNDDTQKQLMKCVWSETIQIRNIYASSRGYTVVEDMNGNYYSAGYNEDGACTVNNESGYSDSILNMTPFTPITYFKQNNLKILQVFVSNMGDAPFWKAEDGSIYTSCNDNYGGRVGVEVDKNKLIHKIPFLSQLSIKKMVSGGDCSIAICNDGSVYSTGTGYDNGDNGLGAKGVDNESWKCIECLEDIIDCDFGWRFVIFLSSSGRVFSAGFNDQGQLGLNTKEDEYEHIMRNPTEIEYFQDASKYMNDMADELKAITHLPDAIVGIIIIHLPPVIPIVSIRCHVYGVVALDCSGNVYQWGKSVTEGSDILCPQQIKLEGKVVAIETGLYHCICQAERGHFISIGTGDYGECCRDNVDDTSPQIINEWILRQINSKERHIDILSVVPGNECNYILSEELE